MAIVKKAMANTSEIDLGKTYAREFPVDDNVTTTGGAAGIEFASLFAVKGDGTSAYFYEGTESGSGATAIKADATDETKEAIGIIITTSVKSVYGGLDLNSKYIMKPFGTDHENMTTPPCKEVILKVIDDTAPKANVFNVDTVKLSGTIEIDGTTAVTGTSTAFTTELAGGDLISVDGEIREVSVITDDTTVTVSEAFAGSSTDEDGYRWTDYGRTVYLGTAGNFTKVKPVISGNFRQPVGQIVSGTHVQIKIEKGEIVA